MKNINELKSKRFYKDQLGRWFKRYETGAVMVTDEWLIDTLDIKEEMETIVQKEREEAYKKVKAQLDILHDKKQSQLHGGYDDADFLNAYCMALSDAEDAIDNLSQTKGGIE